MKALSIGALAMTLLFAAVLTRSVAGNSPSVAESWISGWNSHDANKLASLFTDDVTYEDVAFAQISHGPAELRKFAADEFAAVPDLHVELVNSSVMGDHGTIEWKFSGTDSGMFKTGKKFEVRGVSVITVKNGKIERNVDYYDVATLMRQVGALPAAGGTK
jgi:steroid delta-isomerase-like uncharacterized protein